MAELSLPAPALGRSVPEPARPTPNPLAADGAAPHVEQRVAVLSILGFWSFYFVLNTLRMAIGMHSGDQLVLMGRRAVVVVVGIAITMAMYAVLRQLERRCMLVLVTAVFVLSVPASLAYATCNITMFYLVAPVESVMREMEMFQSKFSFPVQIAETASEWYFFIVSWGVLYVALSYAARVRYAERTAARFRADAQSAQLRALRYQVNPHFLFNTLNSLSTLVLRHRTDEADRMILNLSTFFRTSLTVDPAEDILLGEEIRMQRLYLDIEKVRFPDRLQIEIDVPPELENASVPGMILQPLVENAIKHGVARATGPVRVAIRGRAEGNTLVLTVENDAATDNPKPASAGHGVGLRNVCERIAARFDGAGRCTYGPRADGGFVVELRFPLERRDRAQ